MILSHISKISLERKQNFRCNSNLIYRQVGLKLNFWTFESNCTLHLKRHLCLSSWGLLNYCLRVSTDLNKNWPGMWILEPKFIYFSSNLIKLHTCPKLMLVHSVYLRNYSIFFLNETEVPDKGKIFFLLVYWLSSWYMMFSELIFLLCWKSTWWFLVSCQGIESLHSFFFSQRSLVNIQRDFINHIWAQVISR